MPYQAASERLPPAADGNEFRDPQPMQRERESLEHTALSGISIKSLPSELREPCRREGRNCVRDRGVEDSRTRPTKSTEQSSDELTRSSVKIFYLSVPECVSKWVYNSCAFSWGSFPFVSLPYPTLM